MSLTRLRVPAHALARGAEQPSPKASIRLEERLVRQEIVQRSKVRAEVAPHVGVVFVHVGLGDFEEIGGGLNAPLRQGICVVLDAQPVDRRQGETLDGRSQERQIVAPVLDAEEARLLRVDLHPVVRPACKCQTGRPFPQERRSDLAVGRPCPKRYMPEGVVLSVIVDDGVVNEALLSDRDANARFAAFNLRVEVRVSSLVQPRAHHLRDRLARSGCQGVPEVHGVGVVVAVLDQIVVESLPEILGAEEVFEHPQDGAALAVADGVEELPDLRRVLDLLMDGVGVLQAVEAERACRVGRNKARPRVPFREQVVDRHAPHPRGEALV